MGDMATCRFLTKGISSKGGGWCFIVSVLASPIKTPRAGNCKGKPQAQSQGNIDFPFGSRRAITYESLDEKAFGVTSWPGLLEVGAHGVDLVDDVLHAMDAEPQLVFGMETKPKDGDSCRGCQISK